MFAPSLSRVLRASTIPARDISTVKLLQSAYPALDEDLLRERVLDGEAVAADVLASVTRQVHALKEKSGQVPGLAVVLVRSCAECWCR